MSEFKHMTNLELLRYAAASSETPLEIELYRRLSSMVDDFQIMANKAMNTPENFTVSSIVDEIVENLEVSCQKV